MTAVQELPAQAGRLQIAGIGAQVVLSGLTGLSTKDTTGVADLRWSGWAIGIYFLAGRIIFGLVAVHYRAQQARTHDDARPACRSQMVSRL